MPTRKAKRIAIEYHVRLGQGIREEGRRVKLHSLMLEKINSSAHDCEIDLCITEYLY